MKNLAQRIEELPNRDLRYVKSFLEMMLVERGSAKNTYVSYEIDLMQFSIYVYDLKLSIKEVQSDNIKSYLRDLKNQGYGERTISRRISSIKQFYQFLYAEKVMSHDPGHLIETPKLTKYLPKFLSEQEVAKLIETSQMQALKNDNGLRLLAMLELLYATGLRVSELCSLPLAVAIRKSGFIEVMGKGDKERIIPLTTVSQDVLNQWLQIRHKYVNKKYLNDKKPYLFPSKSAKDGKISRHTFARLLKELAWDSGIDTPHRVSPHTIRHTFATHLLSNGADLRVLQQMLGHADIATTQIYTHVQDKNLINAVKHNHPLADLDF